MRRPNKVGCRRYIEIDTLPGILDHQTENLTGAFRESGCIKVLRGNTRMNQDQIGKDLPRSWLKVGFVLAAKTFRIERSNEFITDTISHQQKGLVSPQHLLSYCLPPNSRLPPIFIFPTSLFLSPAFCCLFKWLLLLQHRPVPPSWIPLSREPSLLRRLK